MSLEWHNIDETFVHIHWPTFKLKFKWYLNMIMSQPN
jgi:hypothetical protein